jgi:hypothetical protein
MGNFIKSAIMQLGRHKAKLRDGKTTVLFESETPKKNSPVFILTDDGTTIPAPEGELELENGKTAIINKNSLLEAILNDGNVESYLRVMESGKPSNETFLSKLKLNY